jgi:hypothetical protein
VTVAFLARDVPAAGYRTFALAKGVEPVTATTVRFDGNVLENDAYRVTFDATRGGIANLVDKRIGKDLVDASSAYALGQVIYASGGGEREGESNWNWPYRDRVTTSSPADLRIEPGVAGPVFSSAKLIGSTDLMPRVELEVVLPERGRHADFIYRIDKKMVLDREAVYFAFPFAGAEPRFRYEVGGGSVDPSRDLLPGACRDWFAVQRWVTVNTDNAGVAWCPIDTPLVTLCDMTPGKWATDLPITNGTLFAYAMNNYWFTNYKAGQDGRFVFRYRLTSDESIDPASATRFGASAVQPLRAVQVSPGRRTGDLPASMSFCRVEPETVELTALKRADDGDGVIVRVRGTAGRATRATIATALPGVKQAIRCDLVERDQTPLAIDEGRVSFDLPAWGTATVRLK